MHVTLEIRNEILSRRHIRQTRGKYKLKEWDYNPSIDDTFVLTLYVCFCLLDREVSELPWGKFSYTGEAIEDAPSSQLRST